MRLLPMTHDVGAVDGDPMARGESGYSTCATCEHRCGRLGRAEPSATSCVVEAADEHDPDVAGVVVVAVATDAIDVSGLPGSAVCGDEEVIGDVAISTAVHMERLDLPQDTFVAAAGSARGDAVMDRHSNLGAIGARATRRTCAPSAARKNTGSEKISRETFAVGCHRAALIVR